MRIFIILSIVFIAFSVTSSFAEDTDTSEKFYYIPGWYYAGCGTVSASYGTSVADVAMQEIEGQNKITNCSNCRSPAVLISVNEEARTYVEQSVCSGSNYTYAVQLVDASVINDQNTGSPKCP